MTTLAALAGHHRARAPRAARHRHDLPPSVGVRGRGDHHRPRVAADGSSCRYGAAWFEDEHRQLGIPFPRLKDRVDAFEEAVQIVRGLLTTDDFSFEGRHFSVEHATLQPEAGAAAAPADLDRRVGREAHDADRRALRRRVALLRTTERVREKSAKLSRMARAGGTRPVEITRAASLSLEDDADTIARRIERWTDAGFGYLVCGWPAGGREQVDAFDAVPAAVAVGHARASGVATPCPDSTQALNITPTGTIPASSRQGDHGGRTVDPTRGARNRNRRPPDAPVAEPPPHGRRRGGRGASWSR